MEILSTKQKKRKMVKRQIKKTYHRRYLGEPLGMTLGMEKRKDTMRKDTIISLARLNNLWQQGKGRKKSWLNSSFGT